MSASHNLPTSLLNARLRIGRVSLSLFVTSRKLGVPCSVGGAAARPRTPLVQSEVVCNDRFPERPG
eukprot:6637408-Alexandrium_andersonii.AAC.1